ncbi:8-amino-7-oxononanoate synthase [Porphyridium purpureum]|uniref:8-amino-7-oxononanoate synthase n=1 Tax=Porphyridium purpureum TaxID=35688 RepID=A0A5J4ZAJ6_PORPP|nr:8-amino-7-oxononanoate synthase [Porphyridium purpureum]|eukprot:POR4236..scf295_1
MDVPPSRCEQRMLEKLESRAARGLRRAIWPTYNHVDPQGAHTDSSSQAFLNAAASNSSAARVDFASNDYLGVSTSCLQLHERCANRYAEFVRAFRPRATDERGEPAGCRLGAMNGSTGSRVLTGNSWHHEALELRSAVFHDAPCALLFNSGYDANLALLSCVPASAIVYDESVHASMHDGIRLSRASITRSFKHNCVDDLRAALRELRSEHACKDIVVVIESLYSMSGDVAPLKRILAAVNEHDADLVVDEAHAVGIYGDHGQGLCFERRVQTHPRLLARVVTFGKAFGAQGAAVVPRSHLVREYLLNYARPLVFSTSLAVPLVICLLETYEFMASSEASQRRARLSVLSDYFDMHARSMKHVAWGPSGSGSPIKSAFMPGNDYCVRAAMFLRAGGYLVYAIRAPTVPEGSERIRVVLHATNTVAEIDGLLRALDEFVQHSARPGLPATASDVLNPRSKL